MSTTVSYNGQTLTTVSNDTKTLFTEGKYLEDDLTLTDVSGGGAVLTTKNISANGTYNASSDSADGYSQVNVAVPASAVDTGTKNITANGSNQDVVGYAAVNVAVPNSYSASDEGKVVSNGALVAQTAHADVTPTTSDHTIDTTTNNSIKVKGDADLIATNIKKDVEIFGVTGSYEGGGGGTTMYSGEFTPAERTGIMTFYAPNCTHLAIMSFEAADKTTGSAFLTSIIGKVDTSLQNGCLVTTCQSNNSGSNETVSSGLVNNISNFPYYSYANDTFTVNLSGNGSGTVSSTTKVWQVGRKYNWWAW